MTRRDMIIIAILVNTGLLAILFMMAINSDTDKISDISPISVTVQPPSEIVVAQAVSEPAFTPPPVVVDEGDVALKEFSAAPVQLPVIAEEIVPVPDSEEADEVESAKPEPQAEPEKPAPQPKDSEKKLVEVTVKRGDSLDKIARANGTTIKEIKEVNQLTSSRLDIGQVLKVPVGSKKKVAASEPVKPAKTTKPAPAAKTSKHPENKQVAASDVEYYTIKSGDNPWKIARQFHVKVDDLLKLNNMTEEKARNLKAGEKIRVR